jgi:hypothetical protein
MSFDHSPEKSFSKSAGELWFGVKIENATGFSDESSLKIVEELHQVLLEKAVGEISGSSSGAGQLDATYDVNDMWHAASIIRTFMHEKYPATAFWISDDYEIIFDQT